MKPEMRAETVEVSSIRNASSVTPDEFLTTKELMKLLKIKHRQTIYELVSSGLPAILVNRNYRFIKAEVIEFLRNASVNNNKRKKRKQNSYGQENSLD